MKKLGLTTLITDAHYSRTQRRRPTRHGLQMAISAVFQSGIRLLRSASCLKKDGTTLRTLYLKGVTQTYIILDVVLPVNNYKSTLKVTPKDKGASYDWLGNFGAKGVADADAVKTMTGVYQAGVDALADKTSN